MSQQPPNAPNPLNAPRQVRLELPANLVIEYANVTVITQTHSEIVLDFVQVMPNDPRARVQSRIVLTPANAKALMLALQDNLGRFEAKNGEIKLPARPTTLADQLFGTIRIDGEDGGEEQ
jgi:hypothetical protein